MKSDNKGAWIGFGAVIIAALITGVINLMQKPTEPSKQPAKIENSGGGVIQNIDGDATVITHTGIGDINVTDEEE